MSKKIYNIDRSEGFKLILDNGGGFTLQLSEKPRWETLVWQHWYNADQLEQLRDDVYAWIDGSNPLEWDGNDIGENQENFIDPTYDDICNGGYVEVFSTDDLISANGWGEVDELLKLFDLEA